MFSPGLSETVPKKARRGPFYLSLLFLSWNGKHFLSIHQKEGVYEAESDCPIVDHLYRLTVDGVFVDGKGEAGGAWKE